MPDARPVPDGWVDPQARVPRQGQIVRVQTTRGTDHAAQFAVAHTDDWPSGVSWVLHTGGALAFAEGVAWHPDPEARPTSEAAQTSEAAGPVARPALFDELLDEVERTAAVLRLLPGEATDWSPHPDIPTLRVLSHRLVRIVGRMGWILELDRVELSLEPDLSALQTPTEIVETFEANAATVRTLADRLDGAALAAPWLLERGGVAVARLPRGNALRRFGLTPLVYHRAEVALLLTAMGIHPPHPYPQWPMAHEAGDGQGAPAPGAAA